MVDEAGKPLMEEEGKEADDGKTEEEKKVSFPLLLGTQVLRHAFARIPRTAFGAIFH
jgi:hypothetical protein